MFTGGGLAELWDDSHELRSSVVRLVMAFFERDGADSQAGASLLRGSLQTIADNKAVEELHHACKVEVKARSNKKEPGHHLQHVIVNSGVLENRSIPHSANVTEDSFLSKWRDRASLPKDKHAHNASSHKLPAEWSDITNVKQWRTSSEVADRTSASAWYWLRSFAPGGQPTPGVNVNDALFSRWLLPGMVFHSIATDDDYMASLGRGSNNNSNNNKQQQQQQQQ